ncbi:stress-activated map kinase interacting protein 1-domain-containing protein [Apiospora hydei]|uniref:Stress-activated map kinase interacting protein 1-domain-containing protein n=1 Tax=Apiospora hydei TaxID=1337664 RepID=A0ABR1WZU6_9PEZI
MLTGVSGDTPGPGAATRRRRERRREQMEEDDSSDLSDESDDESDQRAAQQIRFAKMPVRNRSGSSPIQSSNLRQATTMSSPRAAPGARRGSQSALETVKERHRRDTVTSSEVSSENEFDASGFHKQREASRAAARAVKLQAKISADPIQPARRVESDLLAEEEDSDMSDGSSAFAESVDSASILADVEDPVVNASPGQQVVGTPPKQLMRQSTVRKPPTQPTPGSLQALPPPRPLSIIRPLSMMQPRSLLSDAFKAKKTKPAMPFEQFATLSGQGDPDPFHLRIYVPSCETPSKPFEVLIRKSILEEDGSFRPVTVAEKKLLNAFTTANNRAGRSRSNSKVHDDFGLVLASEEEFEENQEMTPQYDQQETAEEAEEEEPTPKSTPQAQASEFVPAMPRPNPIINTTYRHDSADKPTPPTMSATPTVRGEKRFLRVHIFSQDAAPGQMLTLEVTTERYLAEVLDEVCLKRRLDKNTHVLKLPGSGAVVMLDRTVSSIGNWLFPKVHVWDNAIAPQKKKKDKVATPHPLAQESMMLDEAGSGSVNYKKYIVWRKQAMRFVGLNERILRIDGEYVTIQPSSGGKVTREGGKTTTVHFSNVVGCSVSRRHPMNFKLLVFKEDVSKRYDFETKSVDEAAEIVRELKRGVAPYNKDI